MKYTVLIPEDVAASGKEYLRNRGYLLKIGVPTDMESLKREIADADAVLVRNAKYPVEVLAAGERLKVVARHGTGVDNIAVAEAERLGIWVVNGPTANINTVAEYAVALVMSLGCWLPRLDRRTREGDWSLRTAMDRRELHGKTLGIVGFGRIGRLVAEKAGLGLGMRILAYDPRPLDDVPANVVMEGGLDRLLAEADYVTAHLPATPETRGMFNYAAFGKMRPGAFFINCARGEICVEADLVRALGEGLIAGAGIDVYEDEPRLESPLFAMDQVIVSQHNAGLSVEANEKMSLHAAIGVDEILSGKIPTWPVNHPAKPR